MYVAILERACFTGSVSSSLPSLSSSLIWSLDCDGTSYVCVYVYWEVCRTIRMHYVQSMYTCIYGIPTCTHIRRGRERERERYTQTNAKGSYSKHSRLYHLTKCLAHTQMSPPMYVCLCMYAYISTKHVCMYTHTHTLILECLHTNTHTHIHKLLN